MAILGVFALFVTGCGAITAASVVKQGAMWAGKQVAKKEYDEYKEQKRAQKQEEAQREQSAQYEARHGNGTTNGS